MKIEMVEPKRLKPWPDNPRTISKDALARLAGLLDAHGFIDPVIARREDHVVIGGHQRLRANARRNKPDRKVPVIFLEGLDDGQAAALNIALNNPYAMGDYDLPKLADIIANLKIPQVDLSTVTGFTQQWLETLVAQHGPGTSEDSVPPLQEKAVSQAGDVWVLGEHLLVCGDATNEADVERCLQGDKPFLMVTDPPYGVEYDAAWRTGAARTGKVANDNRCDWSAAWSLAPCDVAYCWHAGRYASDVQRSLEATGYVVRTQIIWSKPHFPVSRGHYHWRHEPCWYATRKGKSARWRGGRKQTTVWEITLDKNVEGGHSTQKPVECMARPIRNHGKPGDIVYEPFCGSGTTIIAAEQLERRCRAIEIVPQYVDVAVRRWQQFTGKKAKLDANGKTFQAIAKARK